MIVGPGGENIYPEDIESVLNSHVCIADSIVTEQEGRLVALVHFNRDEIEAMIDDWREEWNTKKEAWEAKTEQLKKEIMDFVNAKVSRFSRISEVVEEKEEFVKTPTQKIRRFLYNRKKGYNLQEIYETPLPLVLLGEYLIVRFEYLKVIQVSII